MDHLPKEPAMLVSAVNMLLRDEEFDSLPQLCYCFGQDADTLKGYLQRHGFVWNERQKQFKEQ